MAAQEAPLSLGFSRQEYWSGLPFPSPMHESEKSKGSRSVMADSSWPHGLQPTRLLRPWDFPGKSTGEGCHCLLQIGRTANHSLVSYFLLSSQLEFRQNQYSQSLSSIWDSGAWWAAVYGVTQSRTRLKQLGSSSKLSMPTNLENSAVATGLEKVNFHSNP